MAEPTQVDHEIELAQRDELISTLLTLLDLIEVKEDWTLTEQRFEIMEEYGTWTVKGETSSEIH